MRQGEILSLRWSDLVLARKVVHITSSPSFKTKAGRRRTIPLGDTALYLLTSKQGRSASEYVFTLNDRPIAAGWVSHLFKRYVRVAQFDDRLYFHSLRHSLASWPVQGGATLYEVQRLLGHSSPKVTEIYAHLQPDQMHDTVNRIKLPLN
jgi:integrase